MGPKYASLSINDITLKMIKICVIIKPQKFNEQIIIDKGIIYDINVQYIIYILLTG
jgi:hypothetical protein